jgi:hypothetical protein
MSRFLVDHVDEVKMSVAEVVRRHKSESDLSSVRLEILRVLVAKTRERLETLYKIFNDVWKEQQMELTPEFPLVVYSEGILPEIANARDFGNELIRSIPFRIAAPLGLLDYTESDWREAQDWLRSTWRQKVEADAKEHSHLLPKGRQKSRRGRPPGKRRRETIALDEAIKQGRVEIRCNDGDPHSTLRMLKFLAEKKAGLQLPAGWRRRHGVKTWPEVMRKYQRDGEKQFKHIVANRFAKVKSPSP